VRFASLGSGSSGNASLVASEEAVLLVDCGFGIRDTVRRLERLDISPEDITAILVTHEHGDHFKGVAPLARKFNLPVYLTPGTLLAREVGKIPQTHFIRNYAPFTIADIQVEPVAVPHDAREPAQFVFKCQGLKLGVLTDLGSVTPHVVAAYNGCHGLLVEANHDLDMLWNGPYPPSLKSRVASDWGHLNNVQTAELLELLHFNGLQQLVVGHISKKNNSVEAVKTSLARHCQLSNPDSAIYACQDEGFSWLELLQPAGAERQ